MTYTMLMFGYFPSYSYKFYQIGICMTLRWNVHFKHVCPWISYIVHNFGNSYFSYSYQSVGSSLWVFSLQLKLGLEILSRKRVFPHRSRTSVYISLSFHVIDYVYTLQFLKGRVPYYFLDVVFKRTILRK